MQLHLHPHPLMNFYCLQYLQFIQLFEKLVALPCCSIEEDYLLKFRKEIFLQSRKQIIEPLKYDEQGVAFSTAEGNLLVLFLTSDREAFEDLGNQILFNISLSV